MNEPHTAYAFPQGEVIPLETFRRDAVERGGGKGANLGELIAAGLDVPPGFCVVTAAYQRAVVEFASVCTARAPPLTAGLLVQVSVDSAHVVFADP